MRLQALNQKSQELSARIEAQNREEKIIDAELIKRYYQYVENIEKGARGEKSVLLNIRAKDFTPDDLKLRIDRMLARKDLRIAMDK